MCAIGLTSIFTTMCIESNKCCDIKVCTIKRYINHRNKLEYIVVESHASLSLFNHQWDCIFYNIMHVLHDMLLALFITYDLTKLFQVLMSSSRAQTHIR